MVSADNFTFYFFSYENLQADSQERKRVVPRDEMIIDKATRQ